MFDTRRSDDVTQPLESLEGRTLLSGSFHFPKPPPPPPPPQPITITADLNADKKADLITITPAFKGSAVLVQLGKGNGLFVASDAELVKGPVLAAVTGDFNNDGKLDLGLISKGATETSIQVLAGNGAGKVGAPAVFKLGASEATRFSAGEINGDGYTDLVGWNTNNDVWVWLSNTDASVGVVGPFQLTPDLQPQSNPFGDATIVGTGDFFNTGRLQLIGVSGDSIFGGLAMASTGDFISTFAVEVGSTIPLADKKLSLADVNGDGLNDLVALGDGSVNVALGTVDAAKFGAWIATTSKAVSSTRSLVADVDGDGKTDVFTPGLNFCLFRFGKAVLISQGDGTFKLLFA